MVLPKTGENPGDVVEGKLVWFHVSAVEVTLSASKTQLFKVNPPSSPKDTGITIVSRCYDNVRCGVPGFRLLSSCAHLHLVVFRLYLRSAPLSFTLMMRTLVSHCESYFFPPVHLPSCSCTFTCAGLTTSCSRAYERASTKYPAFAHPGTSQIKHLHKVTLVPHFSAQDIRYHGARNSGRLYIVLVVVLKAVRGQHMVPRHPAYI